MSVFCIWISSPPVSQGTTTCAVSRLAGRVEDGRDVAAGAPLEAHGVHGEANLPVEAVQGSRTSVRAALFESPSRTGEPAAWQPCGAGSGSGPDMSRYAGNIRPTTSVGAPRAPRAGRRAYPTTQRTKA